MSHDPLCPMPTSKFMAAACRCDLIAAVRERTLDEAVAAVERVPWSVTFTDLWVADKRDVLDAIAALRQATP